MQLLRPGILVSLKTELRGGALYERVDIEHERVDGGQDRAKWETTRVIEDAEEYQRGQKARSRASGLIRRACVPSSFGLICPEGREGQLDEAVREARRVADEYNAGAQHSTVAVYVLKGRIASTDEEAARAIAAEIRGLLEQMESGVRRVDAGAIRDAAARAKKLGQALSEDQAKKVGEAVAAARKAATEIVKRVTKGGELAETVVAELEKETAEIGAARFSFLDLDEPEPAAAPGEALPAVSDQRFAELEEPKEPAA